MDTLVRQPYAAGQFYPGEKSELLNMLQKLEADSGRPNDFRRKELLGLIVPHAGYQFSGKTAMSAYLSLKGRPKGSYILIGPNHRSDPYRTAIYPSGSWNTPLGKVPVDGVMVKQFQDADDHILLDEGSHSGEHSLEVQIPILQHMLQDKFSIIPVLMGNQEKKEAMRMVKTLDQLDFDTPLLVSSDLNHYENLNTTIRKDSLIIDSITSLDVNRFYKTLEKEHVSACGFGPIAVLMEYTKMKGGSIELLDHSTSYHFSRDMDSVVGYASLAALM